MKNMNRPAPLCGVSCKLTRRPCKTVQSTHPRGVRHLFEHGHQLRQIISTHAPREGCDAGAEGGKQVGVDISIHAPREGCDGMMIATTMQSARFQSTHPARGATVWVPYHPFILPISIHAPREGCDAHNADSGGGQIVHFNPRTPRGVRRRNVHRDIVIRQFQSTHPARGATCPANFKIVSSLFQSTHPARGATPASSDTLLPETISIHAPREGCDGDHLEALTCSGVFQSTHPARGATSRLHAVGQLNLFQSTHPARGATANFTKEQRVCLAQFAYLHKGKKAEHTKTNAPMLH